MYRIHLFLQWYKLLRSKQYPKLLCVDYAWYNSKYYTTDGKYRK